MNNFRVNLFKRYFTGVATCFFLLLFISCSSECQTCTKDSEEPVEICEEDYDAGTVAFSYERILMVQEELGWNCE